MKRLLFLFALILSLNGYAQQPGIMYVPSDTFAHWISLPGYVIVSNANKTFVGSPGHYGYTVANKACHVGFKYYWETTIDSKTNGFEILGISSVIPTSSNTVNQLGIEPNTQGYTARTGGCCIENELPPLSTGCNGSGCTPQATGQILSIVIDNTGGTTQVGYYINGTFQILVNLTLGIYYPACASDGDPSPGQGTTNFGQSAYTYKTAICASCQNL